MIRSTEARAEAARRQAQDAFTRGRAKEAEIVKEREKGFAAQTQKTARLRALRLAREANDQAVATAAAEVESSTKKPAKKARKPKTAE
jgi:hypothetical protein